MLNGYCRAVRATCCLVRDMALAGAVCEARHATLLTWRVASAWQPEALFAGCAMPCVCVLKSAGYIMTNIPKSLDPNSKACLQRTRRWVGSRTRTFSRMPLG